MLELGLHTDKSAAPQCRTVFDFQAFGQNLVLLIPVWVLIFQKIIARSRGISERISKGCRVPDEKK